MSIKNAGDIVMNLPTVYSIYKHRTTAHIQQQILKQTKHNLCAT